MDRICSEVLDRIFTLSPMGRYVIIDGDEFFETFPEGSEKNYCELNRVLNTLKSGGYIDIKYSKGDLYCVAPIKKYVENQIIDNTVIVNEDEKVKKINFIFLSAFIGGALGSLIVSLIFAVL